MGMISRCRRNRWRRYSKNLQDHSSSVVVQMTGGLESRRLEKQVKTVRNRSGSVVWAKETDVAFGGVCLVLRINVTMGPAMTCCKNQRMIPKGALYIAVDHSRIGAQISIILSPAR